MCTAPSQRVCRSEARWRNAFLIICVTALAVLLTLVLPALYRWRGGAATAPNTAAAICDGGGVCPSSGAAAAKAGDPLVDAIVREVMRQVEERRRTGGSGGDSAVL